MNSFLKKLLAPRSLEYLTCNQNLIILETSHNVHQLADWPHEVQPGKDVRLGFPELVGVEHLLMEVWQGQRASFELKGISRTLERNSPLYIDIQTVEYLDEATLERCLIFLIEDVTETMILKQVLVQRANESELLLSALAASKDYIDKIITSMADALFVTTASGIIKTVNQAAQDLFGYQETELLKQPIERIIPDKIFLGQSTQQLPSPQKPGLKPVEVNCRKKTGEEMIVEFSCSTIQTEIKDLYDFVYIGRDITEQKRIELEVHKALEKEKELNELKSSFISVASHQFRTPLSTIRMSVELLENYSHNLTEERKFQYFHQIRSAVRQMTELMDDVLILSKAEARKAEFNPVQLDLQQFCQVLVEDMRLSDGNQHTLNFVCQGTCTNAWIDEKLLRHILTNLLSNAFKYSPPGSLVSFTLTCKDKEVIFEIQDQGIGIPSENKSRLFETFYRAKNVGKIPGTGLGLAIVKNSVNLHGGEITFTSESGVGTTFKVTIPLTHSHLIS